MKNFFFKRIYFIVNNISCDKICFRTSGFKDFIYLDLDTLFRVYFLLLLFINIVNYFINL